MDKTCDSKFAIITFSVVLTRLNKIMSSPVFFLSQLFCFTERLLVLVTQSVRCVCVSPRTITLEFNDFSQRGYIFRRFVLIYTLYCWNVNVIVMGYGKVSSIRR